MAGLWKFIICNRDGTGEREVLNAYERKYNEPLNRLPSASFRVRLDHPLATRILTADLYLKVYRGTTLMFCGPIITTEEASEAENKTVQANAVGAFWYLAHRLIGKNAGGYALGTAAELYGRAYIAQRILETINAEDYCGLSVGTIDSMSANAHVGPLFFQSAGEAIAELAVGLNSYDFYVSPTEPTDVGSSQYRLGYFNAVTLKGAQKDAVVFEYGGIQRPQVASYKRAVSREGLLTVGYALPPGWPTVSDDTPADQRDVVYNIDSGAVAARGRVEEVVSTELVHNELRQELINEHVRVRSVPRHVLTFTLSQNATPAAFAAYATGDRIRARAIIGGTVRMDAFFRVWGITVSLDNAGNESVELELTEQEPAAS